MHLSRVSIAVILLKLQQCCYWSADGSSMKDMFNYFLCNVFIFNTDEKISFTRETLHRFGFVACKCFRFFVLFCSFLRMFQMYIFKATYCSHLLLVVMTKATFFCHLGTASTCNLQNWYMYNYCSGVSIEKLTSFSLRSHHCFTVKYIVFLFRLSCVFEKKEGAGDRKCNFSLLCFIVNGNCYKRKENRHL